MEEENKPTLEELIKRFAEVNSLTEEEAKELVGADTEEEVLKNIEKYILNKINEKMPKLNRAQRRQLAKKHQIDNFQREALQDTVKKLNYIDLIQKLRILNERNQENGENATEDNGNLQG